MMGRLQDIAKSKRPSSMKILKVDNLRNSIVTNRSVSKKQMDRNRDIENSRMLNKLFEAKSTLNLKRQSTSFSDHLKRSEMLSKYKKNQKGGIIRKNAVSVEKRMLLQPIHKKLMVYEQKTRVIRTNVSPIKFNSFKLTQINP